MLPSRCIDGLDPFTAVVPSPVAPVSVGELAGAEDLTDSNVEDVFTAKAIAFSHRENFLPAPICHNFISLLFYNYNNNIYN